MMARKITGYNVYHAPDGCAPSFYGFVESLDEARKLAGGPSLEQSLWDTARAAGHCAGLRAPEGDEEDEPTEWFGDDGYDSKHGKTVEQVYGWWREYSEDCRNFDQSAILWEFVRWYDGKLTGKAVPA